MLTLAHQVAGRLRLVGSVLRTHQADALVRQAHGLPGVTGVRIGAASGSMVVFYDNAPHVRDAILQSLGVTTSVPAGSVRPRVLDCLAKAVVEKLLGYAAQAVIASVL